MNNGVLKTYDSKNQTALYKAKDNRLYEIISIDTDCAVMAAAFDDTFAVAAKPFLDEINNVIDFQALNISLTEFKQRATAKYFISAMPNRMHKNNSVSR